MSSLINAITTKVPTAYKLPLIVILGATGTGKSKLAIELASKYNGEIISADSMQVYKELDIITNKVTKEEREIVPHHLIDFISPLKTYTVQDFNSCALPLIEKLHSRGKVPVIVGGTCYYIESILWKILINSPHSSKISSDELIHDKEQKLFTKQSVLNEDPPLDRHEDAHPTSDQRVTSEGQDLSTNVSEANPLKRKFWKDMDSSTEELYKLLGDIDPETASKYHPNQRRKIIRSLQVWEQTGKLHSELLKEQRKEGGSILGGGLRFPGAQVFWIHCDKDVLHNRLDERVDTMIASGLIAELDNFHNAYNKQHLENKGNSCIQEEDEGSTNNESKHSTPCDEKPAHYSAGIFQSIGFKEFHEYLILSPEGRETDFGQKLYKNGIDKVKQVTRRYSKLQMKWIKYRILLALDRQLPDIYKLEGTDVTKWDENVRLPAETILDAIIADETPPIPPYKMDLAEATARHAEKVDMTRHICEICNTVIFGLSKWDVHLNGGKHRRNVKYKERKAKEEEFKQGNNDDSSCKKICLEKSLTILTD